MSSLYARFLEANCRMEHDGPDLSVWCSKSATDILNKYKAEHPEFTCSTYQDHNKLTWYDLPNHYLG